MGGYNYMRAKAWQPSWFTNTGGIVGGPFEERVALRAEVLETLQAGPGEAARQEVAVGVSGPVPCRWTLRTLRVSIEWLAEYTVSGVWRVLHACGLGLHASCARLFSPDPAYRSKVRRLHRCLRDAARHPDTVAALFLDEFGYQRWPEVAPTWGREAAVAQRAGNNQQWRTVGALNALTGQVNYLDGYIVGRQQVIAFSTQLNRTYPTVDLLSVIPDNWNIHTHPDVLAALAKYPRIKPVWLPTYAPWPPGSIPLRNCGAGCAKISSRCLAGWRTGPRSNTGCAISLISLLMALKTCYGMWAW
jgi:hypothetical protein